MTLSKIDKDILNVMFDNARLSMRQIAKRINVSAATVMNHLNLLEKNGTIISYKPRLNYEKAGFDVEVIIEVNISEGKYSNFQKKLVNHPNVFYVYDVTGNTDAVIIARFPTRRKLDSFLKKLQTYEFITKVQTKLILNTLKENTTLDGL